MIAGKIDHHGRSGQGVAVGLGALRHLLARNGAVAADPVLDHELLTEHLAHALAGQER